MMNAIRQFESQLPYYEKVDFGKYKMQNDRRILFQFPKGSRVYDTDLDSWFDGNNVDKGGVEDINATNNPTKYFDTLDEAVNRTFTNNVTTGSVSIVTGGIQVATNNTDTIS